MLGRAGVKNLFLLKILGEVGVKEPFNLIYWGWGWHEKLLSTENARLG